MGVERSKQKSIESYGMACDMKNEEGCMWYSVLKASKK